MDHSEELRQEHRLLTQETIFLELASGSPEEGADSRLLASHSMDISANGLQIIVDEALIIGSILSSCVVLQEPHRQFRLMTEVKWARRQEGQWLVGLSLFESEGTDIREWKEAIAYRCAL